MIDERDGECYMFLHVLHITAACRGFAIRANHAERTREPRRLWATWALRFGRSALAPAPDLSPGGDGPSLSADPPDLAAKQLMRGYLKNNEAKG